MVKWKLVDWKEVDERVFNRVYDFIYDWCMATTVLLLVLIIHAEKRKKNG